jgi:hypothetical protein
LAGTTEIASSFVIRVASTIVAAPPFPMRPSLLIPISQLWDLAQRRYQQRPVKDKMWLTTTSTLAPRRMMAVFSIPFTS